MRYLVKASLPNHPFNSFVRDGSAQARLQKVLDHIKPEAVYFTEFSGMRAAVLIVDVPDSSRIPAIAEPLFLTFNATVEFHPAMLPEDLAKADLAAIGKNWGW